LPLKGLCRENEGHLQVFRQHMGAFASAGHKVPNGPALETLPPHRPAEEINLAVAKTMPKPFDIERRVGVVDGTVEPGMLEYDKRPVPFQNPPGALQSGEFAAFKVHLDEGHPLPVRDNLVQSFGRHGEDFYLRRERILALADAAKVV